jgi:hypothetical protein
VKRRKVVHAALLEALPREAAGGVALEEVRVTKKTMAEVRVLEALPREAHLQGAG